MHDLELGRKLLDISFNPASGSQLGNCVAALFPLMPQPVNCPEAPIKLAARFTAAVLAAQGSSDSFDSVAVTTAAYKAFREWRLAAAAKHGDGGRSELAWIGLPWSVLPQSQQLDWVRSTEAALAAALEQFAVIRTTYSDGVVADSAVLPLATALQQLGALAAELARCGLGGVKLSLVAATTSPGN